MLDRGSHAADSGKTCLMEMVARLAGEPHTDHPECACPVLTEWGIIANDSMGDDLRNELLGPLAQRLVGTRSTPEVERRRMFLLVDHAVRVAAPQTLEAAGLTKEAATLRGLAEIVDEYTARAAADAANAAVRAANAVYAAYAAADAAAYAAYAAAYAAARAAADAARATADAARATAAATRAAAYATAGAPDTTATNIWRAAVKAFVEAINLT